MQRTEKIIEWNLKVILSILIVLYTHSYNISTKIKPYCY